MVGDQRQGWAVLATMTLLFVVMTVGVMVAEQQTHPALAAMNVDQAAALCSQVAIWKARKLLWYQCIFTVCRCDYCCFLWRGECDA